MKYISEFRSAALARTIAGKIARAADPARQYNFMEFCGGHTHAIFRYGVQDLMPANVRFVHGPGCPQKLQRGCPIIFLAPQLDIVNKTHPIEKIIYPFELFFFAQGSALRLHDQHTPTGDTLAGSGAVSLLRPLDQVKIFLWQRLTGTEQQ